MKKKYCREYAINKRKANVRKEITETIVGLFYMIVISVMAGMIGWLLAAIYLKPDLC